jgi:hypothetical protein
MLLIQLSVHNGVVFQGLPHLLPTAEQAANPDESGTSSQYGLPDAAAIPDWHQMLAAGRKKEYR